MNSKNINIIETPGRLLLQAGGDTVGELDFVIADGQMRIDHVGVRPEYRGQGFARQLVDAAVSVARRENCRILPVCPYAQKVLSRTAQYADILK